MEEEEVASPEKIGGRKEVEGEKVRRELLLEGEGVGQEKMGGKTNENDVNSGMQIMHVDQKEILDEKNKGEEVKEDTKKRRTYKKIQRVGGDQSGEKIDIGMHQKRSLTEERSEGEGDNEDKVEYYKCAKLGAGLADQPCGSQ